MHLARHLLISLFLILLWETPQLLGQSADVVVVSPLVGPTISQNEYRRYSLEGLWEVPTGAIDSLRIIPLEGEQFLAFFYYKNGESDGRPVSRDQVAATRDSIIAAGRVLLDQYQQLKNRWQAGDSLSLTITRWDASVAEGTWKEASPLGLTLQTEYGAMVYVAIEDIAAIEMREPRLDPLLLQQRAHMMGHHYLLTSSALPLETGELYYQNISVFFHTFGYTPVRGLTLTLGSELTTLVLSPFISGFYLIPLYGKVSWSQQLNENWFAGASFTTAGAFTDQGNVFGGLGSVMATYQGEDFQATVGLGWAGIVDRGSSVLGITPVQLARNPTLTLSGRYPVGPRASLITEAWYIRSGGRSGNNLSVSNNFLLSMGPRLELDYMALDLHLLYYGNFQRQQLNGGNVQSSVFGLPIPIPFVSTTFFLGH